MPSLPKEISHFMEKYGVDSDEVWPVPGGKSYAIKHKALERIAIQQGITFDRPSVIACDLVNKSMVICTFGKMGDRNEWSFGEASPANNKNQYMAAMAEKRSRDRVILKLLAVHGDLFSEEEADDFKQQAPRQNPHVTRASDIHDEISNDIPTVNVPKMLVKHSRPEYAALVKEMQRIQDPQELYDWGQAKAAEIHALSGEWPQHFKGEYTKHKQSITNGKAA
jgi:hypothetical protein